MPGRAYDVMYNRESACVRRFSTVQTPLSTLHSFVATNAALFPCRISSDHAPESEQDAVHDMKGAVAGRQQE